MNQTVVVYSTFMPYALIPAGVLQLSKTTEMIWYRWPEVRDTVRTDLMLHAIFVLYWFIGVCFGYRMKNFRRINRVNELVIDGYVYDEVEILMEYPHVLSAQRMGHLIEVGCDKSSHSFIRIDGREIARKIRIV